MATVQLIKNISVKISDDFVFSSDLIGQLEFDCGFNIDDSTIVELTCTNSDSGLTQTSIVNDFIADGIDQEFNINFETLGIYLFGQANVLQSHTLFNTSLKRRKVIAESICNKNIDTDVSATAPDVHIRSAMPIDITIPFISSTLLAKSSADLSLGNYKGWAIYNIPTKQQLAVDGKSPLNSWQPYYGDWTNVGILNTNLVTRIKSEIKSQLILPDLTTANSFKFIWSEWSYLQDQYKHIKYDGDSANLKFELTDETNITPSRVLIYINGILKTTPNILFSKNIIDCSAMSTLLSIGHILTIRYKKYEPSKDELEFNPDLNPDTDNPLLRLQYKYDYQYTLKETRDDFGKLLNSKFYFWVTNKNIATKERALAIQQAKNLLKKNTNPFAILQNVQDIGTADLTGTIQPIKKYNQFIGVGLNRYVTEDNTYKIRFTRDFILRDNPKNIDLKNVHTEWAIIREHQKSRIPEQLWTKLTDAISGLDIAGNSIPSLARIAYDERNGTATRFGFGIDQAFVDSSLALASVKYTILNTKVTTVIANDATVPDPIEFIDQNNIEDYFSSSAIIRKTMNDIWTNAKSSQINEIFFTVLNDALSENYEFSDIFKTSMIAAYSVRLFSTFGAL